LASSIITGFIDHTHLANPGQEAPKIPKNVIT